MKKLIIILIVGVVFVLSICFLVNCFNIQPTDGVLAGKNDIKLTNDKAEIQVGLSNSSMYIIDHKYYIEGDTIYIRIYTSLVVKPGPTKLGDRNISIEMDTSTINKIYLIGCNKTDTKLVWERN